MSKKEKKAGKEKAEKGSKKSKVRICPSCQAEISKKAKVCPHCEAKLKKKGIPLPVILILLVVLLLAGAAVSIFIFHFPIDPPFELAFGGKAPSKTLLGETMELTVEQEEAMLEVLESCGFSQISDVRKIAGGAKSTSYAVNDASTERYVDGDDAIVVQVENETKAVDSITYQDQNLYLGGTVIAKITDYYLGSEERDVYLAAALTAVKARLDLPETAVFPSKSKWTYNMDGDTVTVSSFVTTHDASGTETTQNFLITFEGGEFVSLDFTDENSDG